MGSQVLRLPESPGLILNFQFGKTLRRSAGAAVVLTNRECPQVCVFRGVTGYFSAAQSIGWDLTEGHLFPVVPTDGGRGPVPVTAQRMTAALQGHLRAAEMPDHFTMHSFRVGGSMSNSLAGTVVDEIMKMGGVKDRGNSEVLHGVNHRCTGLRGQRKRDRDYCGSGRATAVYGI